MCLKKKKKKKKVENDTLKIHLIVRPRVIIIFAKKRKYLEFLNFFILFIKYHDSVQYFTHLKKMSLNLIG